MKLNPVFDGVTLPQGIAALPVGPNGFPVPWFVATVKGVPEFRVAELSKFKRAITDGLCWVCGGPLPTRIAFVLGPMCTITRTSAEPPCHVECAEFSARYCPFLARPHMERREGGGIDELPASCPGHMIKRNPGAVAVWVALGFHTFRDGKGGTLIQVGDPIAVGWWREGRAATRAEVSDSIETGLPLLMGLCDSEAAHAELRRATRAAGVYLPRE